jgi:archaellum biogenesis ATPase FlaH
MSVEKQRHQHTVGTRSGPRSREELLYLVDDLVRVDIRDVIVTDQLDEARARDAPGDVATFLYTGIDVPGPVEDERRHRHCR